MGAVGRPASAATGIMGRVLPGGVAVAEVIHVVLMRWSSTAAPDVAARIERLVAAVRAEIPGVVETTHGPGVSPEGLEQGFEYGLYMRFVDAAARDAYLPHPTHQPLARLIGDNADAVLVFDLAAPPTA